MSTRLPRTTSRAGIHHESTTTSNQPACTAGPAFASTSCQHQRRGHYLSAMLLDLQLDARLYTPCDRAAELVTAGADGLFTFEGPHDVFFPLVRRGAARRPT